MLELFTTEERNKCITEDGLDKLERNKRQDGINKSKCGPIMQTKEGQHSTRHVGYAVNNETTVRTTKNITRQKGVKRDGKTNLEKTAGPPRGMRATLVETTALLMHKDLTEELTAYCESSSTSRKTPLAKAAVEF